MDIISRLQRRNNGEIFAVRILDEGSEYNIYIESLHSKEFLEPLISSGWELVSLPYGFIKDNRTFDQLPVEVFEPTINEESDMADFLTDELSIDELKGYMSEQSVSFLTEEEPEEGYKYKTRQEFIEYLISVRDLVDTTPHLPLNYLVAPEARFTEEEYFSEEYREYVTIINNRKVLDIRTFRAFKRWATSKGYNVSTPMNVIETYLRWGICGLNLQFISKNVLSSANDIDTMILKRSTTSNSVAYKSNAIIGVDMNGNPVYPEGTATTYQIAYPKMVQNIISRLQAGEIYPVDANRPSKIDYMEFATLDDKVIITPYSIYYGSKVISQLKVLLPTVNRVELPFKMYGEGFEQEMLELSYLNALADLVMDIRVSGVQKSTYQLLLQSSCSPRAATLFFVYNNGLNKKVSIENGGERTSSEEPLLTDDDVINYFSGSAIEPHKEEIIDEFIEGISNCDEIAKASARSLDSVRQETYQKLYLTRYLLGVDLETIYRNINTSKMNSVRFENKDGSKYIDISIEEIKFFETAYLMDQQSYREEAAKDANFYVYVDRVARELGNANADRHVAYSGWSIRAKNRQIVECMEILRDEYTQRVLTNIPSNRRDYFMGGMNRTCVSQLFQIAFTGKCQYTQRLGGDTVEHYEMVDKIHKSMKFNVESTAATAEYSVNTSMKGTKGFHLYIVNAIITPTKVYPIKKGTEFTVVDFAAVWPSGYSDAVRNKLVEKGHIKVYPNGALEAPWELIMSSNGANYSSLLGTDYWAEWNLFEYYDKALESNSKKNVGDPYLCPEHPIEMLEPNTDLYAPDPTKETSDPNKKPSFKINDPYTMTYEDTESFLGVSVENGPAFKRFTGFKAEDFAALGTNIFNIHVTNVQKEPIAIIDSTHYRDTKGVHYIDNIVTCSSNTPVVNIWGRKYLIRDINSVLWEVTI